MFHVEFQSLSCSSHRESDLEFSGFMSRLFIDSFQSSDKWRVLKTLKLVSASADGTIITLSSLLGLFSPPCRPTARILQCHNLKCAVCPVCSRGLSIRNKTMSSVGSWELLYEHTATLNRTTKVCGECLTDVTYYIFKYKVIGCRDALTPCVCCF